MAQWMDLSSEKLSVWFDDQRKPEFVIVRPWTRDVDWVTPERQESIDAILSVRGGEWMEESNPNLGFKVPVSQASKINWESLFPKMSFREMSEVTSSPIPSNSPHDNEKFGPQFSWVVACENIDINDLSSLFNISNSQAELMRSSGLHVEFFSKELAASLVGQSYIRVSQKTDVNLYSVEPYVANLKVSHEAYEAADEVTRKKWHSGFRHTGFNEKPIVYDLFDDAYSLKEQGVNVELERIKVLPETLTLEEKIDRFHNVLSTLIQSGKRGLLAFSGGKDSSVMANIAINILMDMKRAGQLDQFNRGSPALVFVHSNTRVENPLSSKFALSECAKIEEFAYKHNLPIQVHIVEPSLSNNYLVNIIGGRTVATLPGMGAKCSVMMKVEPITRHKKRIFKEFGADNVFTMIATRRDESGQRGNAMEDRGESEYELVKSSQNEWLLSPVADFTLDDIFMHIAEVRNGLHVTYSDFEGLIEHYRDLNSGACMVNAYSSGKPSTTGCGGRSGCWTCTRVKEDYSLLNMTQDEQLKWLKPLNDFRNLIAYEHWNPDKRRWLARRLNEDGTINLLPVSYSANFCEDLLKYALTIQLREEKEAYRLGISPRFTIIRECDVIAIQMLWSRYGFHKGAAALEIWRDVMIHGNEYDMPAIDPYAKSPYSRGDIKDDFPGYRNLPFADDEFKALFNGFRDVEAAAAGCERVVTKKGIYYSEANVDKEFDIDDEAAALLMDYELDRIIENSSQRYATSVFHTLIRLGTVTLKRGSESDQERMLRMANQVERLGLGCVDSNPLEIAERLKMYANGDLKHPRPGDFLKTTDSSADSTDILENASGCNKALRMDCN